MADTKDKTPVVRPDGNDSDSDEAPEVLSNLSATKQALDQRQKEKEARVKAKEVAKRKTKNKRSTEVPELPEDVLAAIAARNEEVKAAEEEEAAMEQRVKKRNAQKEAKLVKLMEKKTHTRQFGNIQVQTLEALEKTKTKELSASAKKFLELRAAPNRKRMNVMEGHPSQFTKRQKNRCVKKI